jgi:pyruvate dehydrogenase E1 component
LRNLIDTAPFNAKGMRLLSSPKIPVEAIASPAQGAVAMSSQEGFGKILSEIARHDTKMADRIVTTSPDVTVSTNLGGWVNRRAVFSKEPHEDVFQTLKLMSAQRWHSKPSGQHIELGIAENNLFILLAALGLSHKLFGERLLPVGTLYDPFIQRGLDALNYACYQDARFILAATPSGITLAPEGGAHQSISTPLIGMAQDGLATFEPSFVDELAVIMEWAFNYIQRESDDISDDDWLRDKSGGSVYLRLSTRSLDQPVRQLDEATKKGIIAGAYWLRPPAPGAQLALAYTGVVAPEAASAIGKLLNRNPGTGLLAITSADRLNAGWKAAQTARQHGQAKAASYIEELLQPLSRDAGLVTVIDGHPTTLSWLGAVHGHKVQALGVEHFGQTGTIDDLYESYRIGENAILEACKMAVPQKRFKR